MLNVKIFLNLESRYYCIQIVLEILLKHFTGFIASFFDIFLNYVVVSYRGGVTRIIGSFVFNVKRNMVELELKQDSTRRGTQNYAVSGSLN